MASYFKIVPWYTDSRKIENEGVCLTTDKTSEMQKVYWISDSRPFI